MDSYQAIYDAVRSRVHGCDVRQAISDVFPSADISHHSAMVAEEFKNAAYEQMRPSVLFRPRVFVDGNQWCALYGKNLQDGVSGFGDSPAAAMQNFDASWDASLAKQAGGE